MMNRTIDNSQDYLDTRDIQDRIKELEDERADLAAESDDEAEVQEAAKAAIAQWDEDNGEELKTLLAFKEEVEGVTSEWDDGAQLIRDSYFTEAMQELCEDIGDLPKNLPHYIEIDWDKTASNLQADYSSVDFDGVTYWVRSA